MNCNLPITVEIDGKEYSITNKCDYRMVLDVICALNDKEMSDDMKMRCALYIFYDDIKPCRDMNKAISEMFKIIGYDDTQEDGKEESKPKLMDWEHDFKYLVSAVNRILGYDVRNPEIYTHWYTFLSAYFEIGECTWSTVVSIRTKIAKGKKLEQWEKDFYRNNKDMVKLPMTLSEDDRAWLDSDW